MKTSSRTHTSRQKASVQLDYSIAAGRGPWWGQPPRRGSRWLPAIQFKISCLAVFLLPALRLCILILISPRGPSKKESVSWPRWYHLAQLRLQPDWSALPAPSSAPATDVCDHTVLPHPISFPLAPAMLHLAAATTIKSASPVRRNADTKAMEPPQF